MKFEYVPSIISTCAARAFVHHAPNSSLLPSSLFDPDFFKFDEVFAFLLLAIGFVAILLLPATIFPLELVFDNGAGLLLL